MKPFAFALVLTAQLLTATASPLPARPEEWPETIVRYEDLRALNRMVLSVPRLREAGEVRGPAVLRALVDREGQVRRLQLLQSCGSPEHDEAVLHAMRGMRFEPHRVNGEALAVTLVLPLHLPQRKR